MCGGVGRTFKTSLNRRSASLPLLSRLLYPRSDAFARAASDATHALITGSKIKVQWMSEAHTHISSWLFATVRGVIVRVQNTLTRRVKGWTMNISSGCARFTLHCSANCHNLFFCTLIGKLRSKNLFQLVWAEGNFSTVHDSIDLSTKILYVLDAM